MMKRKAYIFLFLKLWILPSSETFADVAKPCESLLQEAPLQGWTTVKTGVYFLQSETQIRARLRHLSQLDVGPNQVHIRQGYLDDETGRVEIESESMLPHFEADLSLLSSLQRHPEIFVATPRARSPEIVLVARFASPINGTVSILYDQATITGIRSHRKSSQQCLDLRLSDGSEVSVLSKQILGYVLLQRQIPPPLSFEL